jgi:hypothetical protein
MMVSMSAVQNAQEDIDMVLHRAFQSERFSLLVQDFTTVELKVLHKLFTRIMQTKGEPLHVDQENTVRGELRSRVDMLKELPREHLEFLAKTPTTPDREIIDVEPVGVSDREEEDVELEETYKSKMVITTTPGNYDSEKDHDSTPAAPPSGPSESETLGAAEEEGEEPVDPSPAKIKWRPPLHTIHFTDAQSFIGYLYGRKHRRK